MSKTEWLETVFFFFCILLLWPLILGYQGTPLRVALYLSLGILIWIAWRRWKRFHQVLEEIQEKDSTFRPLPPRYTRRN
ncbi:MAG: hypothetical protein NZ959_09340 [Armatimonadetes bacterium]|nr:hypothetical protein [Armatimonadota bacterium]MDW8122157.1 hypothetical protein [Armatimonadota bacterium]